MNYENSVCNRCALKKNCEPNGFVCEAIKEYALSLL